MYCLTKVTTANFVPVENPNAVRFLRFQRNIVVAITCKLFRPLSK